MKTIIAIAILLAVGSSGAHAGAPLSVKTGYVGCQTKEMTSKLTSFIVDRDKEAFTKLALAGVLTGQCRTFSVGETAYLEDTAIFSGLVCVRPTGSVNCYWGPMEFTK